MSSTRVKKVNSGFIVESNYLDEIAFAQALIHDSSQIPQLQALSLR